MSDKADDMKTRWAKWKDDASDKAGELKDKMTKKEGRTRVLRKRPAIRQLKMKDMVVGGVKSAAETVEATSRPSTRLPARRKMTSKK